MIRPLRDAHRRVTLALAIALPVLFAAGLATRHQWHSEAGSQVLAAPDVLVYWSATEPKGDQLPQDARIIGEAKRGSLPPGYVIRYSVAYRKVLSTERL
jgi:hypothetical protein